MKHLLWDRDDIVFTLKKLKYRKFISQQNQLKVKDTTNKIIWMVKITKGVCHF